MSDADLFYKIMDVYRELQNVASKLEELKDAIGATTTPDSLNYLVNLLNDKMDDLKSKIGTETDLTTILGKLGTTTQEGTLLYLLNDLNVNKLGTETNSATVLGKLKKIIEQLGDTEIADTLIYLLKDLNENKIGDIYTEDTLNNLLDRNRLAIIDLTSALTSGETEITISESAIINPLSYSRYLTLTEDYYYIATGNTETLDQIYVYSLTDFSFVTSVSLPSDRYMLGGYANGTGGLSYDKQGGYLYALVRDSSGNYYILQYTVSSDGSLTLNTEKNISSIIPSDTPKPTDIAVIDEHVYIICSTSTTSTPTKILKVNWGSLSIEKTITTTAIFGYAPIIYAGCDGTYIWTYVPNSNKFYQFSKNLTLIQTIDRVTLSIDSYGYGIDGMDFRDLTTLDTLVSYASDVRIALGNIKKIGTKYLEYLANASGIINSSPPSRAFVVGVVDSYNNLKYLKVDSSNRLIIANPPNLDKSLSDIYNKLDNIGGSLSVTNFPNWLSNSTKKTDDIVNAINSELTRLAKLKAYNSSTSGWDNVPLEAFNNLKDFFDIPISAIIRTRVYEQGFEDGTSDLTANNCTQTVQNTEVYSGNYALQITISAGQTGNVTTPSRPVSPNQRVTFAFAHKEDANITSVKLIVLWYRANGGLISSEEYSLTLTSSWKVDYRTVTAPNKAATMKLRLEATTGASDGNVYLDDMTIDLVGQIFKVDGAGNLAITIEEESIGLISALESQQPRKVYGYDGSSWVPLKVTSDGKVVGVLG